eukprot:TRINITY_DN15811_c0_g1_i2.p1 TRINITY_DN15811_c0_g1~~TRINITY_DN15811_c0_g1_i2.p1  ORF type:complete len:1091 (-),score=254.45 TRINITY_DN15811_c0_g1_i2:124-3396(-)
MGQLPQRAAASCGGGAPGGVCSTGNGDDAARGSHQHHPNHGRAHKSVIGGAAFDDDIFGSSGSGSNVLAEEAQPTLCERLAQTQLPCEEHCIDALAHNIAAIAEDRLDFKNLDLKDLELPPADERYEMQVIKQLLTFAGELPHEERGLFEDDVNSFCYRELREELADALKELREPLGFDDLKPPVENPYSKPNRTPMPAAGAAFTKSATVLQKWKKYFETIGLEALAHSEVAVIILASSNDKRVGKGIPTGIADIGLLSKKPIFRLFCERLLRLKHLVRVHNQKVLDRMDAQLDAKAEYDKKKKQLAALSENELLKMQEGGAVALPDVDLTDSATGADDEEGSSAAGPRYVFGSIHSENSGGGFAAASSSIKSSSESRAKTGSSGDFQVTAISSSSLASSSAFSSSYSSSLVSRRGPQDADASGSATLGGGAESSVKSASNSTVKFNDGEEEATARSSAASPRTFGAPLSASAAASALVSSRKRTMVKRKLQERASAGCSIPMYVMCNQDTQDDVRSWFFASEFCGLPEDDIGFFSIRMKPCMDMQGKPMLEWRQQVAAHPEGDGGVYAALRREGVVADLRSRGVEHVFIGTHDNLLLRIADPVFIGYCIASKVKAGIKCEERPTWSKPFDIFCTRTVYRIHHKGWHGHNPHLQEHPVLQREKDAWHADVPALIPPENVDEDVLARTVGSNLMFNLASLDQCYFSLKYLSSWARHSPLRWHARKRRQPHVAMPGGHLVWPPQDELNSIRLEVHIGDILEVCRTVAAYVVPHAEEEACFLDPSGNFNAEAVQALTRTHTDWLWAAGAEFAAIVMDDPLLTRCEVSPLVSYAGEGLKNCFDPRGKIVLPAHFRSRTELPVDKAPGSDELIAGSIDGDSELCVTPDEVCQERDTWQERVAAVFQQVEDRLEEEHLKRLKEQGYGMFDDDNDGAGSVGSDHTGHSSPKGAHHWQHGHGSSHSGSHHGSHHSEGALMDAADPFEYALRHGIRNPKPFKTFREESSVTCKVPNGSLRRIRLLQRRFAPSMFGPLSGYRPVPEPRPPRFPEREEAYGKDGFVGRQGLYEQAHLTEGQKEAQWVLKNPKREGVVAHVR